VWLMGFTCGVVVVIFSTEAGMARRYRRRKECECLLIREFLERLGLRVLNLAMHERPDAIVTLVSGADRMRMGLEHTDYYSDAPAGQASALGNLYDFWKAVRYSLARR